MRPAAKVAPTRAWGGLFDAGLVALALGLMLARSPVAALPWWLGHLAFEAVPAPPSLTSWMTSGAPPEVADLAEAFVEQAQALDLTVTGPGPDPVARLAVRAAFAAPGPPGLEAQIAAFEGADRPARLEAWLAAAWVGELEASLEQAILGEEAVGRAVGRAAAAGHGEPQKYTVHRVFLPADQQVLADRYVAGPVALATLLRLAWPVDAPYFISSKYGDRVHPVFKRRMLHNGVDIAVPVGTPVLAAQAGQVAAVSTDDRNGLWVRIDHGQGVSTSYCHLDEAEVVVGDEVLRDQVFARSGNSGASKGPHVHYVVRIGRQSFDPLHFHPVPHGARGAMVVAPRVGAVSAPP